MIAPRILIFGGSFDPIHNGHLFIAQSAAEHIGAERVIFLPTRRPQHRAELSAPIAERIAMLRAAVRDNPLFAVDESDARDGASGYTVDILPIVARAFPDARLSFLVGEDSITRAKWHRFDDVVAQLDQLLVAPRDATDCAHGPELEELLRGLAPQTRERIEVLPLPRITISATAIRTHWALGQSVRYLVPEAVFTYLHTHRPYGQTAATTVEKECA